MAEAPVVDGHDVCVGLEGEIAIGVCSPALGDVACIAVDLIGLALVLQFIVLLELTIYHNSSG